MTLTSTKLYQDILREKEHGAFPIPSLPDMLSALRVGAMEDFTTESYEVTCCVERRALHEWVIFTVGDNNIISYDDEDDDPQVLIKNPNIESVSALIASLLRENPSCLKTWATEHQVSYINGGMNNE